MAASCPICLDEDIRDGEYASLTATCQHEFCRSCLCTWFERNDLTCPKCRAQANVADVVRITGRPLAKLNDQQRQHQMQDEGHNENLVDAFTLVWLQDNDARQCPACGHWIVRSQGCDHMRCHCRRSFDYSRALFAADWDGHSHPMEAAAKCKKWETFKMIMEKRNRGEVMREFASLLGNVMGEGDCETVHALLDVFREYDSDVGDQFKRLVLEMAPDYDKEHTILYNACLFGNYQIVAVLVGEVMVPYDTDELHRFCREPFVLVAMNDACKEGDFNTMRMLLALFPGLAKLDHNDVGGLQQIPLYNACAAGNLEIVEYLLCHGGAGAADIGCLRYDEWSLTEAMVFACLGGNLQRVRWLVRLFPELLTTEYHGHAPLYYARANRQTAVVEHLLLQIQPCINDW